MATPKTGPKVQQFMNGRYKGMPVSRRMELAVKAVLDGRYNVSESARQHGVTRARLSEQVGEKRRALADMGSRSKAAAAARQVETAPATVIEPLTEGTVVPKLEVTGEARRIPPFPEFVRKYFGTLECPDCGRHHELPDFHVEMMEALAGPDKRLLVNMPPYHRLSVTTPLLTANRGWITMADVEPGDLVFSLDGTPTLVRGVSSVLDRPAYTVRFDDGAEIVADAEHRWWIDPASAGMVPRFMTTAELVAAGTHYPSGAARWRVPMPDPLELPDVDLPVDPYCLGAWLGDGTTSNPSFFTSADPEIPARLELAGMTIRRQANTDYGWLVSGGPGGRGSWRRAVLGSCPDGKSIPAEYLAASFKQRLALLQGLMDTDGTVKRSTGECKFTQLPGRLLTDTVALVRTLGIKPRLRTETRPDGGVIGRLEFFTDLPVFNLARKAEILSAANAAKGRRSIGHRRIVAITPGESLPGRCIRVAHPSETFLAGRELIPTGNSKSTVATVQHTVYELCRDPNTRVLVVSKSQKLAERFLYQITKYLSDPNVYPDDANLLLDWGPFNTGGEQWNKQQLYIAGRQSAEKDPSVSALGVGGHIYGIRADTIKFDDIADLENQRNAERVKEMLTWCTQEAASRVGRNGKLQFIGTRISAGDIYSYLQDLPSFKTVRYPCILDEEKKLTLWPDHFPFDSAALQRESMSIEQWQLVYQNVDTPGFGASFPPEVVEATYDASRPLGHYDPRWALVAGLDPAGANSQSGYTALVLVGVDLQSGMRYLVDLVAVKQMKAPQLRDQIFDWADKYPLRELRVESNGLQSQLVQYNQEILGHLTSRGTRVVPHITTGHNKWDPQFGVESMASMFINRQISLPTQDVASRNRIRPLVEQLQAFPMGAVSDLVMAFWFAELGIRETFQRASLPMFDPRMRLPNRVASKRRVFDFAERTVKGAPAVEPAWGRPMFPNSEPATEHKLVNVSGSVFVP